MDGPLSRQTVDDLDEDVRGGGSGEVGFVSIGIRFDVFIGL